MGVGSAEDKTDIFVVSGRCPGVAVCYICSAGNGRLWGIQALIGSSEEEEGSENNTFEKSRVEFQEEMGVAVCHGGDLPYTRRPSGNQSKSLEEGIVGSGAVGLLRGGGDVADRALASWAAVVGAGGGEFSGRRGGKKGTVQKRFKRGTEPLFCLGTAERRSCRQAARNKISVSDQWKATRDEQSFARKKDLRGDWKQRRAWGVLSLAVNATSEEVGLSREEGELGRAQAGRLTDNLRVRRKEPSRGNYGLRRKGNGTCINGLKEWGGKGNALNVFCRLPSTKQEKLRAPDCFSPWGSERQRQRPRGNSFTSGDERPKGNKKGRLHKSTRTL